MYASKSLQNLNLITFMLPEKPTVPFFAVFSTFFKLQILVILSKMPQNTFFFQESLCVHFYGNKMKNTVFQAKILFSSSKILFSFVRGWHLCVTCKCSTYMLKCRFFFLSQIFFILFCVSIFNLFLLFHLFDHICFVYCLIM